MNGVLGLQWEVPQLPQTIEHQDPSHYISPDLTNTLRGGRVESGQLGDEIERLYGHWGASVHEAILELLRSRDVAQSPDGYRLTYSNNLVECAFSNIDQNSRSDYLNAVWNGYVFS